MTSLENKQPQVMAMSSNDLRTKLQAHLRNNGSLGQLKSQLRSMILNEVLVNTQLQQNKTQGPQRTDFSNRSHALADSFVYEHLVATERRYSLSVFSSEASTGIPVGAAEADHLRSLFNLAQPPDRGCSVLEQLLASAIRLHREKFASLEAGCQTVPQEVPSLEQRLALVDSSFATQHQFRRESTRAEFEMKLSEYRREIEDELRVEMKRELDAFRSKELAEVRVAEEQKYKMLLNLKQMELQELERTIERKGELQQQRVESLKQELDIQRVALEKRQKDVLSIVCERDEQILFLEQQANEVRARLRQAQSLVAQYEETAASHLMDVERARLREQRRMEDLRRMQSDHMVEMRLRDEEITDLQRRLQSLAHENHAVRPILDPLPETKLPQQARQPSDSTNETKRATEQHLNSVPQSTVPLVTHVPPAVVLAAASSRPNINEMNEVQPVVFEQRSGASQSVISEHTRELDASAGPNSVHGNHQNMSLSTIANNATTLKRDDETPSRDRTRSSSSIASSPSTFSKSSNDSSMIASMRIDWAAQQGAVLVNESDARADVESNEIASRVAVNELRVSLLSLLREVTPLTNDETTSRNQITQDEASDFTSIKWSEKNGREAIAAAKGSRTVPVNRFDAPVVIHRDSDDDDDKLLFGNDNSDDSDF